MVYAMDFEKPLVDLENKLNELKSLQGAKQKDVADEIIYLEDQLEKLKELIYSELTPWQIIQITRHPSRPRTLDYLNYIFNDFTELHGDRLYHDDPAIVGGLARFDKTFVMVVGHQKGKNAKSNVHRNFGMPHPEGYRKALRLFKMAEKFSLPVVTFIDTPGAYPGVGAEKRGQSLAIAENVKELSMLNTVVISVNIGEGGSGGALALSVGDALIMLENSYYSVASPEACASILWHDETKAPKAAEELNLTSKDLIKLGIVDEIVTEPLGGAHRDPDEVYYHLRNTLKKHINKLKKSKIEDVKKKRWERIRAFGNFSEEK